MHLNGLGIKTFHKHLKEDLGNADGEGARGRKSWKHPLLFCRLLIVMIEHNVLLL